MKPDFLIIFTKVFFGITLFLVTMPLLYISVCFVNENVFGWGKNVTYCVIEPTNKEGSLYSDEYKLIGIRRWQVTNIVLGIYPTASDAFNASKTLNCTVDR